MKKTISNKWQYAIKEGLKLGVIVGTLITLAETLVYERKSLEYLLSGSFLLKWLINLVLFSSGMCLVRLWEWNVKDKSKLRSK